MRPWVVTHDVSYVELSTQEGGKGLFGEVGFGDLGFGEKLGLGIWGFGDLYPPFTSLTQRNAHTHTPHNSRYKKRMRQLRDESF